MNSNRLTELDGLRGVAVGVVVAYHATAYPARGFAGVDIFFVLSGYLITQLLLDEVAASGRVDYASFYARRVRRIVPALAAAVAMTLTAGVVLLSSDGMGQLLRSAAAGATFTANTYFRITSGGYFDTSSDELPLLHLWSLAVEEQFYLVWPVLVALSIGLSNSARLWGLSALAGASFLASIALAASHPSIAFYESLPRAWELFAGALIAAVKPVRVPPAAVASASLLLVYGCAVPAGTFPGLGAAPAVVGTAVLVGAIRSRSNLGLIGALLRSKALVGLGLVSYSLYLLHWPLLALYRATVVGPANPWMLAAICLASLLLAICSHRYIEQPVRRASWNPRLTVGGCLVLLSVVACAAWLFSSRPPPSVMSPSELLALRVSADRPTNWSRCHYQGWHEGALRKECYRFNGRPDIVLWGDSMALSWKPMADATGEMLGREVETFSRDACPPVMQFARTRPVPNHARCARWNRDVLSRVASARTVFLAARWTADFGPEEYDSATAALRDTLESLSAADQIFLLGPTPELRDDLPKCIRSGIPDSCAISRNQFESSAAEWKLRLSSVSEDFDNVIVVDPTDFFCDAAKCSGFHGDLALYWDSHHISRSAATKFARTWVTQGSDGRLRVGH